MACREQVELVQDVAIRVGRAFDDVRMQILRYQNTLCAVNNLPTEILSYVFRLVAGSGAVCSTNLRVASVCSHWRTVSLHDPVVWSSFDVTCTDRYIKLALSRAQSVPIFILETPKAGTLNRLACLAKDQHHRLRVLELRGSRHIGTQFLKELAGMPLPLLNEFLYRDHTSSTHILPLASIPNSTGLRRLSLRDCILNPNKWSRERLKLTSLVIINDKSLSLGGLYEGLIALCQAAPKLEKLIVRCPSARPIPSSLGLQETAIHEPAFMGALQTFLINVPPTFAIRLLSSLIIPVQNPAAFQISVDTGGAEQPKPNFAAQLWTPDCLPVAMLSELQELEIRYQFSDVVTLDGSRYVGNLDEFQHREIYVSCNLPPPSRGHLSRVQNHLGPVVSYLLGTPMPKLKHIEIAQSLHVKHAIHANRRDLRGITASFHQLLVNFSSLTSITIRLTLVDILIGLRFRLPAIPGTPVFPFLQKLTLQVRQRVRSSIVYIFVRQLCPVSLSELRFEGVFFEVRTLQEAEEFVRDDLPRLAREVWVTGSQVGLKGEELRPVMSHWPVGSQCPFKVGNLAGVKNLYMPPY